ncbi:MAG TPA: hypothetical protein VFY49_07790 [Myxococcota bacterium]|nr:hypothetical protein [Myxococcota bacterium]
MDGERLVVSERFCGPPGAGNGGYVAGLVAQRLGDRAEVTLRRPTPVEAPLSLCRAEDGWRLESAGDGAVLVEGREAEPVLTRMAIPPVPEFDVALAASRWTTSEHPYPHCFVCGPARQAGDGLRIFAGPLSCEHAGVVAGAWVPDASLAAADTQGRVEPLFVWSALDCPGAMVVIAESPRPLLLARMVAEVAGSVRVGERCVVVGWRIAQEGRKHWSGTALYGEDGALRGASEQLWIEPRAAA